MKIITFELPVQEKDGQPDPNQKGLFFNTYMMQQVNLNPGDKMEFPIRDTATGWYEDWSDNDIIKYYDNRYKKYGLVTSVRTGDNF